MRGAAHAPQTAAGRRTHRSGTGCVARDTRGSPGTPRTAGGDGIVGAIAPLPDIDDLDDCERLVRAFYGRALHDPVIGFIFTDVAKLDLEEHVPVVASFWATILLGARSYTGGAFHPHAALHARVRLREGHFRRWLALWHETVDELFDGPRAEQAKAHADRVAFAFHGRLQTLAPGGEDPVPGLMVTRHGRADPPAD